MRGKYLGAAVALVLTGLSLTVAPAMAADNPSPFATVGPSSAAEPTPAIQAPEVPQGADDLLPTAIINPQFGKLDQTVRLSGQRWPNSSSVVATTCGNNGIGGSAVCSDSGAGTFQTDSQGTFSGPFTYRRPPKPCPCVVHVTSPQSISVVDLPVQITGLATGPVVNNTADTRVSSSIKVSGSGPIFWSWFGGSAKRDVAVTLNNLGSDAIPNVEVNLAIGKGSDPTDSVVNTKVGTLQAGETKIVKIPIQLGAPAFGKYTVKATLQNVTATNEAARATTSAYPWAAFVLLWLLLQPLLLGLYKRRPSAVEGDEDPFAAVGDPLAPSPVPVAAMAGAGALGAVAASSALDAEFGVFDQGGPVAPLAYQPAADRGYLVPATTRALVPNYQAVFGVTDLRAYLDPAAAGRATQTAAPRIVIGGLIPTAPPVAAEPVDPAWPTAAEQNGHGQL